MPKMVSVFLCGFYVEIKNDVFVLLSSHNSVFDNGH